MLLSTQVSQATGYTEDEVKQILLKKMNRDAISYKSAFNTRAVSHDSWAAITLCYGTSDPSVFIKAVGKKKTGG